MVTVAACPRAVQRASFAAPHFLIRVALPASALKTLPSAVALVADGTRLLA